MSHDSWATLRAIAGHIFQKMRATSCRQDHSCSASPGLIGGGGQQIILFPTLIIGGFCGVSAYVSDFCYDEVAARRATDLRCGRKWRSAKLHTGPLCRGSGIAEENALYCVNTVARPQLGTSTDIVCRPSLTTHLAMLFSNLACACASARRWARLSQYLKRTIREFSAHTDWALSLGRLALIGAFSWHPLLSQRIVTDLDFGRRLERCYLQDDFQGLNTQVKRNIRLCLDNLRKFERTRRQKMQEDLRLKRAAERVARNPESPEKEGSAQKTFLDQLQSHSTNSARP